MVVRVVQMREQVQDYINVCSNGAGRIFSPFLLGPVNLYNGFKATCVENGWQFSKIYPCHTVSIKNRGICITPKYWKWAKAGWENNRAQRRPMGRGSKPLFSLWKSKRYDYINARKHIYIPLYAKAVFKLKAYEKLKRKYNSLGYLCIKDFDGYDYIKLGMTLEDVLNEPRKIMGHGHVLAMMLDQHISVDIYGNVWVFGKCIK